MKSVLRVSGTIGESIVDGPGIRYVVFAQGCKHKCIGCHNQHTHSFEGGRTIEIDTILQNIKKNPLLDGITLSGGEPFEQAQAFGELAKKASMVGYNVMTYTGYTYEYIMSNLDENEGWIDLIEGTDILVDGRFELSRKNLLLRFRGSDNQRIIDVSKSRRMNKIVLADLDQSFDMEFDKIVIDNNNVACNNI